jgi:hypothetical protein
MVMTKAQVAAKKAKGRRLQQFIRDAILGTFTELESNDVRSTPMSSSGVDIWLSPKAQSVFNYDVECKNDENRSVWKCWKQTSDNVKKGKPLLIMKKNNHDALAVMLVSDMFKLIGENRDLRNELRITGE